MTNKNKADICTETFYDDDSFYDLFQENISVHDYGHSRVAFYHAGGQTHDEVEFVLKGTRSEMIFFLAKSEEKAEEEIREETEDLTEEALREEVWDYIEFYIDGVRIYTIDKINNDLAALDSSLRVVPKKSTLRSFDCTGYSQGEAIKVFYDLDNVRAQRGTDITEEEIMEMVKNYFYDMPIYARAEVNGSEYYYYDMPNADEWNWDREAWIEFLSNSTGVHKDEFEPLIPLWPEYA